MSELKTITIISNAELNSRQSLSIPKRLLQEPVKKYLKSGINPFIDSAAVLFMMASRINALTLAPNFSELRHYVTHELQRFEMAISQEGVDSTTARHCTHLLALMIEQAINRAPWNREIAVPEPLLSPSFSDADSLRNFITQSLHEIALDTVEFVYAVLSLGGTVPDMDDAELKEQCYALIQQSGSQKELRRLSPSLSSSSRKTTSFLRDFSPGLIALIMGVLLFTLFSGMNFFTSRATQQVYHAAGQSS